MYKPNLATRRKEALERITVKREEDKSLRYNLRLKLAETAIYMSVGVGIFGGAAAVYTSFSDNAPDLQPGETHPLRPGETIDGLASEICPDTNRDTVVFFIMDQSGIEKEELGSLPAGKQIVLPDPASC
jgi:hypothetical protein